ncbi:MAG: alanine racemase [Deltaproteobacteria bacterium]|nr:alanine racemase [Deltaproteobacteria bacterium]
MESPHDRWQRLRRAIKDVPLPCALVDLDALEQNARTLDAIARDHKKTLRLATKSVRCPRLIRLILEGGQGTVRGLMTYTASETAFLAAEGHDDLLLAYPTAQRSDAELLAGLCAQGKTVAVVCDDEVQLAVLDAAAARADTKLGICAELDVSYRPAPGLHLGGRRSPLHTPADVVAFAARVRAHAHLRFDGVMAYEGHIAGSTDKNPFTPVMNVPKRLVKLLSKDKVAHTRAQAASALRAAGHELRVVNGGGTGSLRWASDEDALTEVTAGSGYVDSQLFSYYRDLHLEPAAYFALQVVRRPAPGIVACHGGGYVASGEAGVDRLPTPALPAGGALIGFEGAGEVQTPVVLPRGVDVAPGEPFFFRHAKAGELAEHFTEYLLVRGDRIVERAPTYRGLGHCFLG